MSDPTRPEQHEFDPLSTVPDELREAAKAAPDHWLGLVDPGWRGEGAPPRWTVAGEYRSSPEGEVVEWRENEEYRPSPLALGWPQPTDPVDEAVQLSSTGWGPPEDVPQRLAGTIVGIWLAPDGTPLRTRTPDGTAVVPVFTSGEQLQAASQFATSTIPVQELAGLLAADEQLYLNPLSVVAMVVDPGAVLTAAATDGEGEGAETGTAVTGTSPDGSPITA
ncbi:type VII secretion system-associated protein [Streptomyces sp. NRRL S-340]|uniref:type VII secretion system-associated protein n=1 Tax=Streptomyces sp. NRRL S-340 TaxID=1463901 RepID=UPI00055C6B3B|nr:type VII secretion system-associated protein [Streptomyces sp. NRRL S-340]